jgi:hypothetical protein
LFIAAAWRTRVAFSKSKDPNRLILSNFSIASSHSIGGWRPGILDSRLFASPAISRWTEGKMGQKGWMPTKCEQIETRHLL